MLVHTKNTSNMAASFYAEFSGVTFTAYFSVCSIDAVVFMGHGLADVGASHFRLDAVQVQGAVLTSTNCYSVDGHLLVVVRRQHALSVHGRPACHCPRRWKYHLRDLLPPRPVCSILHRIREIG